MPETNHEIKLHALDYWQVVRNRYGVILLAFFLVFMTATVITYMMPKEYLGRVTLQIKRDAKEGKLDPMPAKHYEPYQVFMQTQFAIIESKENLDRVVKEMDLVSRWNVSSSFEAYNRLVRKLRARDLKGTDLIEIEVFDPDPQLAADLANQIADSYKNRRGKLDRDQMQKGIEELEVQARSQEELMEIARAEMFRLEKESGLIELGLNRWNRTDSPDDGGAKIYMTSKVREHEMRAEIASLETTINELIGLDRRQVIPAAVEFGIKNQTLRDRYPEYQTQLLVKRRLRDAGLGAKHPKILEIEGAIELLEGMLLDAVETSRKTLATQLEMKKRDLENVTRLREKAEGDLIKGKSDGVEYIAARDEYYLRRDLLSALNEKVALAKAGHGESHEPIVIHGRAETPTSPAKPNVNLQLAIGAILGLIFGIGLAFFLEYLDTSVKSMEDVEKYLKVPVLAVIPRDVGILHQQGGMSPDAEAYRILRTNIEFNRKSADANSITVVSGGAGEGKSTTLVNLAYICAQGGYSTLMIDGDLRRPKLHTFFDINNSVGLTNYLTTDLALEDVILQTPVDNLFFMPSGILPADAAGILNSRRMSELVGEVKSRFDLVLIDSPPILGVSDASVLASEVDLTMIVIQHRKLPRGMLVRVKQAVENVGGNLLGVVLNNVDLRSDSQYQYYTSYYTYYAPGEAGHRANQPQSPAPESAVVTSDEF